MIVGKSNEVSSKINYIKVGLYKNYRYKNRFVFTILFILLSGRFVAAGDGTKADSLKSIISGTSNEKENISALLILSEYYQQHHDDIAALNAAYKALNKSILIKDEYSTIRARYIITSLKLNILPADSALFYLEEQSIVFEKKNALKELASVQNSMGIIYEKQGRYKQSVYSYFKALFIYDQLSDPIGIANENNNIGLVFHLQKQYTQAVLYFNKALKTGEAFKDDNVKANALNNLAIIYQEQKKPKPALEYFKKVLEIDNKHNNFRNLPLMYNNLGVVHIDLGKYTEAKNYLLESARLKAERNERAGLANTYNNIGELYTRLKLYDSAQVYLQIALTLAKEEGNLPLIKETYETFSTLFEQKGNFYEALKLKKIAQGLNDSITNAETTIAFSLLENDYLNLSREKNELQIATANEKFNLKLRLYGLCLLLGLTVLCFLFYYIIKVKKSNKNLHIKQKKIEIQNKILQVKNIEIMQAKEAAEEAAKVKSQFISTISHEIRTPLNAIIGVANLLNQNSPQPAQYENLNILKISSENLLSLVNNILDFSKMEAGKMQLETIDFNLRSIVFDVKELFSLKSVEKGVELLVQFDEKVPSVLKGDPLRINQLLINLVNNGIKFTETGYVKIEVSLQLSTINHALVHFAISDTGIGISQLKQLQIFESFIQADAKTTRKYGGTGLGLSICKKILENLNSKLQVDSISGKGSTFHFTINFEVSRNASIGKSSKTASFEDSIKGKRVLIVEDNMMNVMVLRQFLQKWGIITEVALNGREGYDRVKESNFDAVLMDIHMPEMDGIEATLLIRKLADLRKRHVPIIAITAENEMQFRQKVYEVGMNDYIFKPFNPDDLKERLGYALYNNTLNISNFKATV
ncbi:MAG: response regulator [Bacteroidia bacterium]|nr:response regulator [Bacteroidia bacterium]